MVAGKLVARRRVGRGVDEPPARAAGGPAPAEPVADRERAHPGAMAHGALGCVVLLGRSPVQRAGELEVVERAARDLLEPAVGTSHPVAAGAVGERDLDAEAGVHPVPTAVDAHTPPAGRDHSDTYPPTRALGRDLLTAGRAGAVDEHERRDRVVHRLVRAVDRKSTRLNSSHLGISY